MKVVCIYDEELISGKNLTLITNGVVYDVVDQDSDCYYIIDNIGSVKFFRKTRFKPLSDIRNEKLEKLLN